MFFTQVFSGIFPIFVKEHYDRQYSVSAYYMGSILVDVSSCFGFLNLLKTFVKLDIFWIF